MSCLCTKLRSKEYFSVTADEKHVLWQTLQQAGHLFEQSSSRHAPQTKKRASNHVLPHAERPTKKPSSSRHNSARGKSITAKDTYPSTQPTNTTASISKDRGASWPNRAASPPISTPILSQVDEHTLCQLKQGILDEATSVDFSSIGTASIAAKLFVACSASKLHMRLASYGLARYHEKGTSLDSIVAEVLKHTSQTEKNVRPNVRKYLYVGRVWAEICQTLAVDDAGEDHIGLLSHISNYTTWERASNELRSQALASLRQERQVHMMARRATPAAKQFLDSITVPFIDDTPAFARNSRIMSTKAPNNERANLAAPQAKFSGSDRSGQAFLVDDTQKLLFLSCFFAPLHDITLAMLRQGTTPRKRWNKDGGITPRNSDVHPHLASFLSDEVKVIAALEKLIERRKVLSTTTNGLRAYKILPDVIREALDSLDSEAVMSWKRQALLVSYYAIPWKNIEPSTPIAAMTVPHLQHVLTLNGPFADDPRRYFSLSRNVIEDLIVTLAEAVRMPKIPWKVFTVNQARAFCQDGQSAFAISRVSESTNLVCRLSKQEISKPNLVPATADPNDYRIHAAAGLTALQECLNEMQEERFLKAEESLAGWKPLSLQPMAQVVLFRKYSLLGQIKRQEGNFNEAVQSLEMALQIVDAYSKVGLYFEEDLPGLACSYADTLRELQSFDKAVEHLQQNLQYATLTSRSRSQIEASLAECLFAKGHEMLKTSGTTPEASSALEEAAELCRHLEKPDRQDALRFDQLRTRLTQAKIFFIREAYTEAEHGFQEAIKIMNKFKRTNGYATMAIIKSMVHTLRRSLDKVNHNAEAQLNRENALQYSCKQLKTLEAMADTGGTRFWIPGLQKWEEWLSTRDNRWQSRL